MKIFKNLKVVGLFLYRVIIRLIIGIGRRPIMSNKSSRRSD